MEFTQKRSLLLQMNELNDAPRLTDAELRPLLLVAAEEVALSGPLDVIPFCFDVRDTVDTAEHPVLVEHARRLLHIMYDMTRD
jgi:hypothetical protein